MLRLGFSCIWGRSPKATWSHIPWNLRENLRQQCTVEDIDLSYPVFADKVLRRLHVPWPPRYNEIRLSRAERALDIDAVLEIGDIGATRSPFFTFQDLSNDMILHLGEDVAMKYQYQHLTKSRIMEMRDRQRLIYDRAAGLIAMSEWFGRSLTSLSGVPPEKVHVVYPGSTATGQPSEPSAARRLNGPRQRLLFVGRNFERKGGQETVAALAILRRDVDPRIQLTIAGPETWPMDGPIPEGVNFVGAIPPDQVAALYDQHDVFVLPSRFEAFGIVFVEALSYGLPCVGRDDFAMPEIIFPGVNGDLVTSESPEELATAIAALLVNDEIFAATQRRSVETAKYFTWRRAAAQTIAAITGTEPPANPLPTIF